LWDGVRSFSKVISDSRYIYQKANSNDSKETEAKELNIQLSHPYMTTGKTIALTR